MNLKHLRNFLNLPEVRKLPDATLVGVVGHFGEFKEAHGKPEVKLVHANWEKRDKAFVAVVIPNVDIGDSPP